MEEWKAVNILEYKDYYEISTFGNVRSLDRSAEESTEGRAGKNHAFKGRILKGSKSRGYNHVELCIKGKRKTFPVHRLMGLTFLENPHNKPQIDHIDRNKSNNKLENLRWVTGCENQANRGIPKNNTSGEMHINIQYKFQVTRQGKTIQKCFNSMEEALEFRKQELGF